MKYYIDDKEFSNGMPQEPRLDPEKFGVSKKAGILEQLVSSIVSPRKLPGLAAQKVSGFVKYTIFLVMLVSFMTTIMPAAATIINFGGFNKLFMNTMPSFRVENGTLKASDDFGMIVNNMHIIIKSDKDEVTKDDLESDGVYAAFGRKNIKMIFFENSAGEDLYTEVYNIPVSEMLPDGFTNKDLADNAWIWYISIFIFFIWRAVMDAIRYMILAAVLMAVNKKLCNSTTLEIYSKELFRMCFYAETIGILLVNINEALQYVLGAVLPSAVGIFIAVIWIRKALKPYIKNQTNAKI